MKHKTLMATSLLLGAVQATALLPNLPGVSSQALAAGAPTASATSATAQDKTRDLLIEKLTQVYLNIAPADASKVAITLRLADLHAERARQDAMNELASGCTVCKAGVEDRKKALAYYQEVLSKIPASSLGKVLAQVGHLYELTGNEKDAIDTYNRILQDSKTPEAVSEAHLSLAEVYFKRRDFTQARTHYGAVLAIPQAASRGLAAYRFAWCEFNEGSLEPAIQGLVKILKDPALLSRNSAGGTIQVDRQFQDEVSRDLATFMARRTVTLADAQLIYELSPEQAKLANLTYLAGEVERLGQAAPAITLWRFVQEKQSQPQARLEGHIRLAQLEMEQGIRKEGIRDFESALALWSQVGDCQASECRELKARLRKFVTDWNRVEKKAPTAELLAAYQSYLKIFSQEADMSLWAAQVAEDVKDYALAVELFQNGAKIASAVTAPKADPAAIEAAKQVEAGLLGAIASAELSKDSTLLVKAYDGYLAQSRERKKAVEVQYQKAHLLYEKADYANAAEALRTVALLKEGTPEIRKQAADLSLDSLVLLKDDHRLEEWATEYAKVFPQQAQDFAAISRKAVLNQSVEAAKTDAGDEAAWKTLARFDLSGATNEEKAAFYKNKLILAEKMQKFSDARETVEQLLRVPGIAKEDEQYALSRKAWLAELVLDFDGALRATEKIATPEISGSKKWLKLAMYADLAAKDPKPFYSQFLKDSKDEDKNVAIAAQLVRDSKEPLKEIERQKAILSKRPEVYAEAYLETYGRASAQGGMDVVKKALSVAALRPTKAGKILARIAFLDEYSKLRAKMVAQQLDGSSQAKMAKTLKARMALMEQAEKLASRAIESGDWTSQLVSLDLLGGQSERFYQEILSLPVPAGLSGEEEQQYLSLLSQQAAPHQLRANDVKKKVSEFWANESAIAQLDESLMKEHGALRAIVVREIQALAEVAPDAKKTQLVAMSERKEEAPVVPALAVLEGARQAVRENPMSRERIEALLNLEKQMGRPAMVAYLEGRLQTLQVTTPPENQTSQTKGAGQ